MGKLIMTTPLPAMPMSPFLRPALHLLGAVQHPEFSLDGSDTDNAEPERFVGSCVDRMTLTALLRVCHALPDADTTTALLEENALTIVETRDPHLSLACELTLRKGLLKAVCMERKKRERYTLLRQPATPTNTSTHFHESLLQAIADPAPLIVVTHSIAALPPNVKKAMTRHVTLPLLSKPLLLEHLRIIHPRSRVTDAALLAEMPDDTALAFVSPVQLVLALRCNSRTAGVAAVRHVAQPRGMHLQFTQLDRIRGLGQTRALLEQTARDLRAWRNGSIKWQDVPRGLLFYGPPGTGKTAAVRALAKDADLHLQSCSLARWQSAGHLGDMLKAMRADFAIARENAPSILFIDEIDSIADRAQTTGHNATYDVTVTNAVIEQLDGIEQNEGVIVIGACNAPDRLDSAMTRSGRFDTHLKFEMPDRRAIRCMLDDALAGQLDNAVLASASERLIGQSGADVAAIVRAARALARSRGLGSKLIAQDLQEILCAQVPDHVVQQDALWRYAVHETGHVFALHHLGRGLPRSVEIGAMGGHVTGASPPAQETLAALEAELTILLAGRAAEFVVLGCVSAGSGGGAQSDLARATELAKAMDSALGLGRSGLVWTDPDKLCIMRDKRLRHAVQKRLVKAETAAITLIGKNTDQFERVAKSLLARRSLDHHALAQLFGIAPTSPVHPKTIEDDGDISVRQEPSQRLH